MHILLTRPVADSEALRQPLEALGHRISVAPLIEISFSDDVPLDLADCAALIATSRNALRALQRRQGLPSRLWDLPLFAVGGATAVLARSLGFMNVTEGAGTAADLVPVIQRSLNSSSGPLLHLSADHSAFDLERALSPHGYEVRQPVVYRSVAASVLPPEVVDDFRSKRIDAIVLMSPRAAKTLVKLLTEHRLTDLAQSCCVIALSGAVAEQLEPWQPRRVVIAGVPKLDAIVKAVSSLTKQFR